MKKLLSAIGCFLLIAAILVGGAIGGWYAKEKGWIHIKDSDPSGVEQKEPKKDADDDDTAALYTVQHTVEEI